jgi:hypothetical protein
MASSALPPASPNAELPPQAPRVPKRSRGWQTPFSRAIKRKSLSANNEVRASRPHFGATTDAPSLPASSQGHRSRLFNSLRFFDYLQIGTCFRFFRFLGDLKSVSSGHERLIAIKIPTRVSPKISPRVSSPTKDPHLHWRTTQCPENGNHCGPVLVFTHCLPPPCRQGVRSEGQRPAKIHHKKRLFLPKYFPCTRWHAQDGTLAGRGRGEEPSLHQLCRLGEDEALST